MEVLYLDDIENLFFYINFLESVRNQRRGNSFLRGRAAVDFLLLLFVHVRKVMFIAELRNSRSPFTKMVCFDLPANVV